MSTINNSASTDYVFIGSTDQHTATSNVNSIELLNNTGLTLTKTASPTEYLAGDIITYTINITNNSSFYLNGVRIIDNIGGGNLAYVLGSAQLTVSGSSYAVTPVATNPLTFTLQQLNVGQSMTLTYKCQVIFNLPSTVTSITNSVNGIGYTSTGTITGSTSTTIQKKNSVSIGIVKTASATSVTPNQNFNYILTLTNNNNAEAVVNSVTDSLPSNYVLTGVTLKIGTNNTITLQPTDYNVSASNVLTLPTNTGPSVTVPVGQTTVITLTGHFV